MTLTIETPAAIEDTTELSDAVAEYLIGVRDVVERENGVVLDVAAFTAMTMDNTAAYLPPRGVTWIARGDDGRLIGMAFLKLIRTDTAEIKRLYVRPEARRQGVAKTLVAEAIAAACELGARRMFLDSHESFLPARRLYESMGFAYRDRYPESETDPEHDGFLIYMERPI